MADLSFPANPVIGDRWPDPPITGVAVWTYDGEKWRITGQAGVTYGRKDGKLEPVLATAGGTMTGPMKITALWPQLILNPTSPSDNDGIYGANWNQYRWAMCVGGAETGGNSGANFRIDRFTDDGTRGTVFSIDRATGTITARCMTVGSLANGWSTITLNKANGGTCAIDGSMPNGAMRWRLALGSPTLETGGNLGSDFVISRYADNGDWLDNPMTINRVNGEVSFTRGIVLPAQYESNFALNASYTSIGGTHYSWLFQSAAPMPTLIFAIHQPGVLARLTFKVENEEYFFDYGGGAYKSVAGPWTGSSDSRIKNIKRNYASGLAQIEQLDPKVYTFKGNDTELSRASFHRNAADSGKEFIGLVAQDVEEVMPELIFRSRGYLDGKEVNDLLGFDGGPLVYALVNAIKELSARVKALSAEG